jgi:UDP-N-acetylglucosamine 2-epimerase (non-hydrolysing)
MIKVLTIFGTRPEAIKLMPVVARLRSDPRFKSRLCITSQHHEMLEQILELYKISPDYNLKVMRFDQSLVYLTSKILRCVSTTLDDWRPDVVLVQGDTTSTMTAALASFYRKIPVAHVEAGLRTGSLYAPFPEEANRRMTSCLSSFHFAPTRENAENLKREGISPETIVITGNTVIDALKDMLERVRKKPVEHFRRALGSEAGSILENNRKVILVTAHRRENFGAGVNNICEAISILASRFPDLLFVYPVHLNPNVQKTVHRRLGRIPNMILLNPLNYETFIFLMNRAFFILTDSGGIQEESPALGKPVLVLRTVSERPEAIKAKTALLVGTDVRRIVQESTKLLRDKEHYLRMSRIRHVYGDGMASERIIRSLHAWFA